MKWLFKTPPGFILKSEHERIVADLEARLAVFTAPRTRGPGGRLVSTRPVGEMGEGGNA